jgi:TIR domain
MAFFRWLRRRPLTSSSDRLAPDSPMGPQPDPAASSSPAAVAPSPVTPAIALPRTDSPSDSPAVSGPIPQYVFISYAHSDEAFAARLSEDLRSRHIALWIDTSGITPGAPDYEQVIRDAIPTSFALVLVGSPAASASVNVRGEIAKAKAIGCPIIPLWAEGERWVDSAPLALAEAQYIDCRGERYDVGCAQLAATLGAIIDQRAPKQTPVTTFNLRDYASIRATAPPGYIMAEVSRAEGALVPPGYLLVETRRGSYVGMRPTAYSSFAALLHDLYTAHLETEYPPFTYGRSWTLAAGRPDDRPDAPSFFVRQVLLPLEWMGATTSTLELTALAASQSASSLARMGLVPGTYWQVSPRVPKATEVIGLATNRQDIAELVIASSRVGDHAQHPKSVTGTLGSILVREGRGYSVEPLPLEHVNSDAYGYSFVLDGLEFPFEARELWGKALVVS